MFLTQPGKTDLSTISDRELVSHILDAKNAVHQRLGQEELYRRYAGKIYHKCLSLVKDPEISKDLAHDIIIKVFLQLDHYKGEANFYSWVFAITYNHCFDYLRKQKKMYTIEISEMPVELVDDASALEHKMLKDATLDIMEEAMKKLSDTERIILTMFYQDGMAIKTIAELLHFGESAVKMRLKRSRDKLAELIQNMINNGTI